MNNKKRKTELVWYKCKKCGHIFVIPNGSKKLKKCPECGSINVEKEEYYKPNHSKI